MFQLKTCNQLDLKWQSFPCPWQHGNVCAAPGNASAPMRWPSENPGSRQTVGKSCIKECLCILLRQITELPRNICSVMASESHVGIVPWTGSIMPVTELVAVSHPLELLLNHPLLFLNPQEPELQSQMPLAPSFSVSSQWQKFAEWRRIFTQRRQCGSRSGHMWQSWRHLTVINQ